MNETTSIDLLTVEEFAERLKISRSTVFGWLKAGLLQEGKHYFRITSGSAGSSVLFGMLVCSWETGG